MTLEGFAWSGFSLPPSGQWIAEDHQEVPRPEKFFDTNKLSIDGIILRHFSTRASRAAQSRRPSPWPPVCLKHKDQFMLNLTAESGLKGPEIQPFPEFIPKMLPC
jgi:hypothetical protein